MPQTGYTPIPLYKSTTAGHIPVNTNLVAGELAINMTDEKLYFKNTGGTVKMLASTAVFTTTGSGSYVLAISPTITGHPTIEGVTATGATGTGKFVFDSAPTITGHPTIEGVTSTGATGTGRFVFDSAPTITGHPTIEGVTSTGATGTGKFVFDSSPTLSGVTLSDGTANGVAYLNSSKVLTSGGALTFDGTNLGVLGSSTNTGLSRLTVQSAAASTITSKTKSQTLKGVTGVGNYTGTNYYTFDANENSYTPNAFFGIVSTNTVGGELCDFVWGLRTTTGSSDLISEQMRLTSTGLGIGTSSPAYKLDVNGAANTSYVRVSGGSGGGTSVGLLDFSSGYTRIISAGASSGTYGGFRVYRANAGVADAQLSIDLDSSGNLGLGVVPSAFSNSILNLQVGSKTSLNFGGSTGALSYNSYFNAGFKYITSDYALDYRQNSGNGYHAWYTAPSGTAGNAITFTQAMTLDASGNLLVGATSGSYKITCNGQPGANGYTAWTNYSDERLKENIVDFVSEPILNKICELRPVSFNYNDKTGFDEETRKRTVSGFIAQEMQQVFPDMVGKTIIGEEEYLDTNLSNLTLYLVKAIQELTARIEKLENKL